MDDESTDIALSNPFAHQERQQVQVLSGLVSVEQQRAVAEIQARMIIARANPRDPLRAMDAILRDCTRPTLAQQAVYSYARGKQTVSGPSIRLMESIARSWGNISSGIKEIARNQDGGYSDCVAYAWDLETGFYDERQFQVRHWRDTREGGYRITDERDIYEMVANMGQRRKRACLMAAIPGDVVDRAVEQCDRTLNTNVDTSPAALQRLVTAFAEYGVTRQQLEKRCQRRIDSIAPAQIVQLRKIYSSLKDEMSAVEDWFESETAGVWSDIDERQQTTQRKQAARKQAATKTAGENPTPPGSTVETKTDNRPDPNEQGLAGEGTQATTRAAQREGAPTPDVPVTPEPPPEDRFGPPAGESKPANAQFEAWLAENGDLSEEYPDRFTDPVRFLLALDALMRKPDAKRENLWEENRDGAEAAAAASTEAKAMLEEMERAASAPVAEEIKPIVVPVDRSGKPQWQRYIPMFTERLDAATAQDYLDIVAAEADTISKMPGSARMAAIKKGAEIAEKLGVAVPDVFRAKPGDDPAIVQCEAFCKDIDGAESLSRLAEIEQSGAISRRYQQWKTERPELAQRMDEASAAVRSRLRSNA